MSSDWNEPGATWQSTPNANWTQSPDLIVPQHVEDDYPLHAQEEAYASEAHDMLHDSFPPEQDVFPDEQETDEGEESSSIANPAPAAQPDSLFQRVWQYVTLIVFPLLFFGIACLLILPAIAKSHPALPPAALWFTAIVLLIIAIGQGVAVYFATPHHNMWILGTLGGLILFVLMGVFTVIGPLAGTLLLLAILGSGVYLGRRCIHSVLEGFVDIVYVSGQYKRTLYPGLNLIWPWEKVMKQVNIEETNWECPRQKIQLSPEEDVTLRAVISYQVFPEDAYLAVTKINNWEESLRNLFVTTLQTIATHFTPTDFLPWPQSMQAYQDQIAHQDSQSAHLPDEGVDDFTAGPARRERINALLFQQMRDRVALWGVQIHWVRIRDIEFASHKPGGVGVPPSMLPDYTTASNDDQVEKDLIAASGVAQSVNVQSNGITGGASGSPAQEATEALQTAAFASNSLPPPPQKLPDEQVLRKTYDMVKAGKVTDPEAIRRYATIFEAVARDPEASQKITFDVERAAANLYEQAQVYEEMYRSGEVYTDITQPNSHMQ